MFTTFFYIDFWYIYTVWLNIQKTNRFWYQKNSQNQRLNICKNQICWSKKSSKNHTNLPKSIPNHPKQPYFKFDLQIPPCFFPTFHAPRAPRSGSELSLSDSAAASPKATVASWRLGRRPQALLPGPKAKDKSSLRSLRCCGLFGKKYERIFVWKNCFIQAFLKNNMFWIRFV